MIKLRTYTHNQATAKYMFTTRHYEALARMCAEMIADTNTIEDREHAWSVATKINNMLQEDSNRFKPKLFAKRIHEVVLRLNPHHNPEKE